MATDTTKITGAADELSAGLTKGGSAAKTLGVEIANAIKSLDTRVSAIEAGGTQPPIEPPPTTNTHGEITNFTATSGGRFKIDGVDTSVQNSNKAWSLANPDKYTLRFEVHRGDPWTSSGGYADRASIDRSEVEYSKQYGNGQQTTGEFSMLVEPGATTHDDWLVLAQLHHSNGPQGGVPFSIDLRGEKIRVVARASNNSSSGEYDVVLWDDPNNIQRGRLYKWKVIFMAGNAGKVQVWRDGTQIANYNGRVGYDLEQYWKFGIYRGNDVQEVMATQIKNIHIIS
jgi:hypothetical protein